MRRRLLVVVMLLVAGCGSDTAPTAQPMPVARVTPPPASAWPQAGHDAARQSGTSAVGPQRADVLWRRDLGAAATPGPAVARDGSVLLGANDGTLRAVDPDTGRDRWVVRGSGPYGNDLSATPAVLQDGTILWPAPGNLLVGLDPATGRRLWTHEMTSFVLSPAVVGARAYVSDTAGAVDALDVSRAGARQAWRVELGGSSWSSPSVAPDGTVITATDATVTALVDRGREVVVRWRFTASDIIEVSTAVGADGTVVVGTNDDDEIGLRPDGTVRWRYDKGDWSYSSPVARGGRAYFGDHLGHLDVVDLATGEEVHRLLGIPRAEGTTSYGTGAWTAPVVDARGNTYFGTAAGHVYGFDADGERLFDLDTGAVVASYPALTADGTLVVGNQDGTVHAIRTAS